MPADSFSSPQLDVCLCLWFSKSSSGKSNCEGGREGGSGRLRSSFKISNSAFSLRPTTPMRDRCMCRRCSKFRCCPREIASNECPIGCVSLLQLSSARADGTYRIFRRPSAIQGSPNCFRRLQSKSIISAHNHRLCFATSSSSRATRQSDYCGFG